ncbi:hypothetical protein Ccrd_024065, partial [Cynara cardunculus var. scolymus]
NQSARIQKPTPPTTTTAPCAGESLQPFTKSLHSTEVCTSVETDDFFLPYDDFGVEDQVAPLFSSNLIFYSKNNPRNKRFHFLYCNGSGTEPTGEPELISEMEEPKDASSSPKANGNRLANIKFLCESSARALVELFLDGSDYDEFGNDLYEIPEVVPIASCNQLQDAPAPGKADEDSKIQALIDTPALDWQQLGWRLCRKKHHLQAMYATDAKPQSETSDWHSENYVSDGSYALPSGAVVVLRPNEYVSSFALRVVSFSGFV